MCETNTAHKQSLCWDCRRSDGDNKANPDGYCSWIAEMKLPEGCEVAEYSYREAGKEKTGVRVKDCPLFVKDGTPLLLPDTKVKNCLFCGKRIEVRRANQLYCNKHCANMMASARKRENRERLLALGKERKHKSE